MALTKKPATPSFETENETVATVEDKVEAQGAQQPATEVKQEAAAKVAATTAVAKASATSAVAVKSVKPQAALQEFQYANGMDIDTVRSLGIGTFPRMLADRAGLMLDGDEIGSWATVELVSYNPRWIVTPSVQGEDAKELVRYSYDKETIEGDVISVGDYLQQLKDDGYEKATIKEYYDVFAILLDSEDATEKANDMIQLQLSPQSVAQFKSFQVQQGIKVARGLAQESTTVKVGLQKKEFGSNKFAIMTFSAA